MPIHTARRPKGLFGAGKSFWMLLLAGVVTLVLSGCSGSGASSAESKGAAAKGGRGGRGAGAVPVSVAKAVTRDVPVEINVIGNVEAYATIGIKAQVAGQITEVYFKEGDFVKKGDQLLMIDPRPFQSTLNQVSANAARDEAAFTQAQANLARDTARARYSEAQAARFAKLAQDGVLSRDQAEQVRATADADAQAVAADKAAIESARAAMAASKAAIENAKIQVGYTVIRAPLSGRTGALNVKQGNIVALNTPDLMTVNQVEPIYVTFAVPETDLPAIRRYMAAQNLMVRVLSQDPAVEADEIGTLTFVDNAVDATTGTIKLKATFPNRNHRLWPGQFVRVNLRLTTNANSIVVPTEAVQTGQDGSFIYVVKENRTVESRPVQTGARLEKVMVIAKGLEAGETVVTEGQLRLAPGSAVTVRGEGGAAAGKTGAANGKGRGAGKGQPKAE